MRQLLAAALAARAAAFHGGSPQQRREVAAADAPWGGDAATPWWEPIKGAEEAPCWDDTGKEERDAPWWEPAAEREHTTPWADHDYEEHESYASGPWAVVALAALGVLAAVYVDADQPEPVVRRRRRRTRHVRPAPSVSEPSSALGPSSRPSPKRFMATTRRTDASPRALVTEMRPFHVFGGAHLRIVRFDLKRPKCGGHHTSR